MVNVVFFTPKGTKVSEEDVTAAGELVLALQGRFASELGGKTFSLSPTAVVTGREDKKSYAKSPWNRVWTELRARNLLPDPVTLGITQGLGKLCAASEEGLVLLGANIGLGDGYAALLHVHPVMDASGPTPPGPPRHITPLDGETVPQGAASPPKPTFRP